MERKAIRIPSNFDLINQVQDLTALYEQQQKEIIMISEILEQLARKLAKLNKIVYIHEKVNQKKGE